MASKRNAVLSRKYETQSGFVSEDMEFPGKPKIIGRKIQNEGLLDLNKEAHDSKRKDLHLFQFSESRIQV